MRGKKMMGGAIIITDLEDGSYICGSTPVKDEDLSKYEYVKVENKKEPNVIGLYKANGIAYFKIWQGDKSGILTNLKQYHQNNLKLEYYSSEIEEFFNKIEVIQEKNLIIGYNI